MLHPPPSIWERSSVLRVPSTPRWERGASRPASLEEVVSNPTLTSTETSMVTTNGDRTAALMTALTAVAAVPESVWIEAENMRMRKKLEAQNR